MYFHEIGKSVCTQLGLSMSEEARGGGALVPERVDGVNDVSSDVATEVVNTANSHLEGAIPCLELALWAYSLPTKPVTSIVSLALYETWSNAQDISRSYSLSP